MSQAMESKEEAEKQTPTEPQVDAPLALNVPVPHATQTVALEVETAVPAAHGMHEL